MSGCRDLLALLADPLLPDLIDTPTQETPMTNQDTLREALDKVKPGDHVTVTVAHKGHTATLSGEVWKGKTGHLFIWPYVVRYVDDGSCDDRITALIEHTPALPPEPEVGALRFDREGDLWWCFEDGWRYLLGDGSWSSGHLSWAEMQAYGSLTDPMEVVK